MLEMPYILTWVLITQVYIYIFFFLPEFSKCVFEINALYYICILLKYKIQQNKMKQNTLFWGQNPNKSVRMYLEQLAKYGLLIYALILPYAGLIPLLQVVFYFFIKFLRGKRVNGITNGAVGWGDPISLSWSSRPLEASQPSHFPFQL